MVSSYIDLAKKDPQAVNPEFAEKLKADEKAKNPEQPGYQCSLI